MKRIIVTGMLAIAMIFYAVPMLAQGDVEQGFNMLKSLAGEWQGKTKDGKKVTASYELISNQSAVMERLKTGKEPEMVTIYHLDKQDLMLTHYCSAKNQPRMRAKSISDDAKQFHFDFLDATNLASPEAGHIHRLALTVQDENHITHAWTWRQEGQEKTNKFEFERVK